MDELGGAFEFFGWIFDALGWIVEVIFDLVSDWGGSDTAQANRRQAQQLPPTNPPLW